MKRIPCGSGLNDRLVQLYRVHSALAEIVDLPAGKQLLGKDKHIVIKEIVENLESFLTCVGNELFAGNETQRLERYRGAIFQVQYVLHYTDPAGLVSLERSLNRLYGEFDRLKKEIFKRKRPGNCESQYTGIRGVYNGVCAK